MNFKEELTDLHKNLDLILEGCLRIEREMIAIRKNLEPVSIFTIWSSLLKRLGVTCEK